MSSYEWVGRALYTSGPAPMPCPDPGLHYDTSIERLAATLNVPVRACDDCTMQYVDWWANEDLWAAVVGAYEGSLCFACFSVRCQDKGIVVVITDSAARYTDDFTVGYQAGFEAGKKWGRESDGSE